MTDSLLITWEAIHKELFIDEHGRSVFSLSTLKQKYGPGLKRSGAVFEMTLGRGKRPVICGWRSVIMNFFILLQQQKYE